MTTLWLSIKRSGTPLGAVDLNSWFEERKNKSKEEIIINFFYLAAALVQKYQSQLWKYIWVKEARVCSLRTVHAAQPCCQAPKEEEESLEGVMLQYGARGAVRLGKVLCIHIPIFLTAAREEEEEEVGGRWWRRMEVEFISQQQKQTAKLFYVSNNTKLDVSETACQS